MFEFENKEKGIYIRVTESEKNYIQKAAKQDKLTVSNFIRKAIKCYVEDHLTKKETKESAMKKFLEGEEYDTL